MNEPITAILSVKTLPNLFFNLTAGRKTIFTELLAFILLKWALRRAHVRSYDSLSDWNWLAIDLLFSESREAKIDAIKIGEIKTRSYCQNSGAFIENGIK